MQEYVTESQVIGLADKSALLNGYGTADRFSFAIIGVTSFAISGCSCRGAEKFGN